MAVAPTFKNNFPRCPDEALPKMHARMRSSTELRGSGSLLNMRKPKKAHEFELLVVSHTERNHDQADTDRHEKQPMYPSLVQAESFKLVGAPLASAAFHDRSYRVTALDFCSLCHGAVHNPGVTVTTSKHIVELPQL